jgi:broad specificity phosphatase PhoE
MPPPPERLHLVRHGEVHNPEHLVYADLPGFGLSERGRSQARAAAAWLAPLPVVAVVSSPLQRAVETAAPIAAAHQLAPVTDEDLTEWALSSRWAGKRWPDLPTVFPGELEAYLADPSDLPFSPEPLAVVGARVATAAERIWDRRATRGHLVVIGHQDPIEAGRRLLTGRNLDQFNASKPAHCTVITLAPAAQGWREISAFTPPQT